MKKVIPILKERAIYVALIALFIIFSCLSSDFLSPNNLINIARQIAVLGIASVGMTYVILIGGIDLSTGSIITFVNIIAAYLMVNMGMNMWLAILIALLSSTAIGFLNGLLVANMNIPSLIVTFRFSNDF
jgi:ribose transport system permease protein